MRVWRLSRHAYCQDRLGEGAKLYGGRWNLQGTCALYCSTARSLAALEYLAHLAGSFPRDVVLVAVDLPEKSFLDCPDIKELPEDWASPFPSLGCQTWGTEWCKSARALGISVPSVIVPEERNVMINCLHPEMARVTLTTIRDFHFDRRLVK